DVTFFLPGTNTPATVSGFGAVFADVDTAGSTSAQFFDAAGNSLGTFQAQPTDSGLSFLGVSFNAGEQVARGRITTGTGIPGQDETAGSDVVFMDDFIYGEPKAVGTAPPPPSPQMPADQRAVINQLVIANLQKIFAQPVPPQIALAMITQ